MRANALSGRLVNEPRKDEKYMLQPSIQSTWLTCLLLCVGLTARAGESQTTESEAKALETIEVIGRRVANLQPASTYAAAVTALRYDPQVDVQARGLAEGQADVAVRGGLFENTGFKLGAVTIFDPQTGHYAAELPIDPGMLTAPSVLTGSANSISAFNASVATVRYGYAKIEPGGTARLAFGSDDLRYASASISHGEPTRNGGTIGLTLAAAGSEGDGTRPFGDHEFKRASGHFQWVGAGHETNLLFGYQDKFFGWPGAYTGFASLPETDHTKQGLAVLDHRHSSDQGWWQAAGAYRWLEDDYDFDRRTVDPGGPGSFEHETRSFSLGINGVRAATHMNWTYAAMLAADRLVRSTDLTGGNFNSRSYLSISLAPEWAWALASGAQIRITAGLRADVSNRDEDALMPLARITWSNPLDNGSRSLSLDLSRTSQLPGYTALKSRPAGLFGGNPDLGREFANTAALSYEQTQDAWRLQASVFVRRDEDLVDWTFLQGAPFARQANPVDLDVFGAELLLDWTSDRWDVVAGYVFLDKDSDYGAALVDASYYALNFARHRATLAFRYRLASTLEIRLDNEFRKQERNILRGSDDKAWLSSISAGWRLPTASDLHLELVADNLTGDDFQEFPGTPAYGRQISLGLALNW